MKLKKITINGHKYDLSNMVVIVGPNNAGKTKFLEELYYELVHSYDSPGAYRGYSSTGNTLWSQMVGQGDFHYEKDEVRDWLDAHRSWKKTEVGNNGNFEDIMLRSNKHVLQWQEAQQAAMYQNELDDISANPLVGGEWLIKFKKSHIGIVRIDSRFTDATYIETVDIGNRDDPRAFYLQTKTLDKLNTHMRKLFNKKFVALQCSAAQYRIMLLDESTTDYPRHARSSSYEAVQGVIEKQSEYADKNTGARISLQSHGTRATAGILIALADKYRKILFIDEPESHMYPAARKYIGALIASESTDRQFFIVTHDVDLLERLANSGKDFTVIKVGTNREIKVADFNHTERRKASSALKNTKAIRAGFNDAAIFVEGITDKYIYEAVIRRKRLIDESIEYGLIDCDGNDRIADSVKFSLQIGTKIAIITDFDTIFQVKKGGAGAIERIIDSVGAPDLLKLKQKVADVRKELKEIESHNKGLGAVGLNESQITMIKQLLAQLKEVGIFIVPYGELYDWFGVSNKGAVAVEILRSRYFRNSTKYKDVTDFLTEVSSYVTSK